MPNINMLSFQKEKKDKHYLSQKHPYILGKSEKIINISLDSVISIGYIQSPRTNTDVFFIYL